MSRGVVVTAVALPPLGNPTYDAVVSDTVYSAVECDAIVSMVSDRWEDATVTTDGGRGRIYDPEVRSVSSQFVPFDDQWPWMRLLEVIAQINDDFHRYSLWGIPTHDRPSLLRYDARSGDHFRPHHDAGPTSSTRRLTYVVQLSPPNAYRGGDLLVGGGRTPQPRGQGSVIVFPAFTTHQVTPVVAGVRQVLVGWLHGPVLR